MTTERLTGAFIKIYKVVDPDGANTQTLIGATRDDVEVTTDVGEAEVRAHDEEITQAKPLNWSQRITFSGIVVTALQALRDLNVLTGGASPRTLRGFASAKLDAVRIKVFENKGDGTSKHNILARDVFVKANGLSYPQEDFASYECELIVNGSITVEDGN